MTWWLWLIIGMAAVAIGIIVIVCLLHRHKLVLLDEADAWLVHEFRRCNVMVFGKKGSGKDVLFAHVIALRGEKHYSKCESIMRLKNALRANNATHYIKKLF